MTGAKEAPAMIMIRGWHSNVISVVTPGHRVRKLQSGKKASKKADSDGDFGLYYDYYV